MGLTTGRVEDIAIVKHLDILSYNFSQHEVFTSTYSDLDDREFGEVSTVMSGKRLEMTRG